MPLLGLHQNKLDFDVIETFDAQTLVIVDKSSYLDNSPEKPTMEVLVPGYSVSKLVPFNAYNVNVINAHQLNISCGDNENMPDGVYCLTLSVCPNDVVYIKKTYLKTDLLEYAIDNALIAVNSCALLTKEIKDIFITIDLLLSTAKAHAREGNIIEATSLYKKIQKLLTKIKCK